MYKCSLYVILQGWLQDECISRSYGTAANMELSVLDFTPSLDCCIQEQERGSSSY